MHYAATVEHNGSYLCSWLEHIDVKAGCCQEAAVQAEPSEKHPSCLCMETMSSKLRLRLQLVPSSRLCIWSKTP